MERAGGSGAAGILVVEDERIVALDLEERLRRLGYAVVGNVRDASAALDLCERTRPDLVLMDIQLPGRLDGVDAAFDLRARLGVPVIYLTAHSDEQTLQRALTAEPFGYIVKPFHEQELRTAIEVALYKHDMERRLKESEEWFATTLASVGDGVLATDAMGRVRFLNAVAESLTGWRSQQAAGTGIGRVFSLRDPVSGADLPNPAVALSRARSGERVDLSALLVARDGAERWIDLSASPIRAARGEISGTVVVFRDITEKRRLEEELRQAQKMEAVGRLAGGVAHDFNNIVTAILGFTEILLGESTPDDPRHSHLLEVKRAGERAASLTHQLLAFSRKQLLAPVVLNLNDVVEETRAMLRRLVEERIELTTRLDPDLALVELDPVRIQQVLVNLVVNARDAMPAGGRLLLETSNRLVAETETAPAEGCRPGPAVCLAVTDSGLGMDAATQARIFEPFFTTKARGKGTGLGLASVHGIVRQSGGWIEVESQPGQGSTFRVYFPASKASVAPPPVSESAEEAGGAETILVAEDEEGVRSLVSRLLESQGYRVIAAACGEDALRLVESTTDPIDLLVSDIIMPGMTGLELARRIAVARPGVPTLFMSGYTDEVLTQNCRREGRNFLQKPFAPREFLRQVRGLLDERSDARTS